MIRELAITIYLFFCKILFKFSHILPLKERTVFVASFPENTEYIAHALTQLSNQHFVILHTPGCMMNKTDNPHWHTYTFSLRKPLDWLYSMYYLGTSRTVFVDNYYGFLAASPFRKHVRCIQIWHAAGAIKRFGMRDPSIANRSVRAKKRFLKVYHSFTHIVSGSEKMAAIFEASFDTERDSILRTGVPRTDFFYDKTKVQNARDLIRQAFSVEGKKIILYAPTYRDDQLHVSDLPLDVPMLTAKLADEYILLLKLHPAVEANLEGFDSNFVHNVSNYRDINSLLAAADMLISDYSSIPFEYALLDRPMIFYAYDLMDYERSRGFWEDYETLVPGPVVQNTAQILQAIEANDFNMDQIQLFQQDWNQYSKGDASERLVTALYEESKKHQTGTAD